MAIRLLLINPLNTPIFLSGGWMSNWRSLINGDPTDWLLEDSNPSVRYFTLHWLLDLRKDDPEALVAFQSITQSVPVQRLLSSQRPEGFWGTDDRPHQGTKRFLKLLMWLGYQEDGDVNKAMDYLINGCLLDDGAYAIELKGRTVKLPCHGADLLRLMFWSGYEKDPRTKKLLDWLLNTQGDDGVWPCVSKLRPFSCMWATVDVLRAYRDLPPDWLTPQIEKSRRKAMEQILGSNLYQYGKGKPSPRWFEFGFPLRFDSDILEVLELLAPFVSPEQEQIQEGVSFVLDKQTTDGRWLCEKYPKGGGWMKKYIEFEEIGQPSKWVTLHAMRLIKTLYGSTS
jgi:hypothetical protein